jgi:hypothetical protein
MYALNRYGFSVEGGENTENIGKVKWLTKYEFK